MIDNKINVDEFQNPFVFNTDWKDAFDDEEFVKIFSSDILENYIIKSIFPICIKHKWILKFVYINFIINHYLKYVIIFL